jgi:hypothetical protein
MSNSSMSNGNKAAGTTTNTMTNANAKATPKS